MGEKYRWLLVVSALLLLVSLVFARVYAAYPRIPPAFAQEMLPGDARYWLPDPYELRQKIYNKTKQIPETAPIVIWKETIPGYEVYRSINITKDNMTISVQYNITRNGTEIVMEKRVLVIRNGTVIVDRYLNYAVITSDNRTVVIPGNKIEQVLRVHERIRERLMNVIANRLAGTNAYNRILEKLNQTEVDISLLDNSTIAINATIPVRVRILFFIPWEVRLHYQETYNVDTGASVYMINRPWWWFLVTRIEG